MKVSEIEIAAGILERSFFDDPGIVNILPKVSDRVKLGGTLASSMVRFTLACGIVVIDDSHRGVALWFPPDSAAPTQDVLRQSGMLDVPSLVGDEAWSRIKALMAELDPLHRLRAKEPHWYLSMIGVEPELQRRGVGHSLLRSTLELVDAQGLSAYLLTPIAELIGFYGRHGFAVAADDHVLGGNLHMRLMRREAARSPGPGA